jgi:hypothetical protein
VSSRSWPGRRRSAMCGGPSTVEEMPREELLLPTGNDDEPEQEQGLDTGVREEAKEGDDTRESSVMGWRWSKGSVNHLGP